MSSPGFISKAVSDLTKYFEGRSVAEQKALLAALERQGAAVCRVLAASEEDRLTRSALLAAAKREEQNAEALEQIAATPPAPITVPPGRGAAHDGPFGDTLLWKAGGEATDSAFSVHERIAPPGSKSAKHIHNAIIEAFYVLDGELHFEIGESAFVGLRGAFVLAPRGVPHGWANEGSTTATALVFFTPPAPSAFLEELDRLVKAARPAAPNRRDVTALAVRYEWI